MAKEGNLAFPTFKTLQTPCRQISLLTSCPVRARVRVIAAVNFLHALMGVTFNLRSTKSFDIVAFLMV
jgi:hypothetical protein